MDDKITKFLSSMSVNFPNFGLWKQDDTKDKKVTKTRLDVIQKFNSGEGKFGIFFSPNGEFDKYEKLTDKTGGKCFCLCVSGSTKDFWKKFPLAPSIINQTIHSYDVFWLLDAAISQEDYADITNQLDTIYALGFARDVKSVYRVPGTVYREDNKGIEKTLTVAFTDKKYSKNDLIQLVLPYRNIEIKSIQAKDHNKSSLYNAVNELEVLDVLTKLDKAIKIKDSVIYKEGTPTDCILVKQFNWIYSKSNLLDGNPYLLAKYYLKTQEEIVKFFFDNFGIGEISTNDSEVIGDDNDDVDFFSSTTVTSPAGDIVFDWDDKSVDIVSKSTKTQILDAYIKPIGYFVRDRSKVCLVKYFKKNGDTGVIELESLGQTNKLDVVLSKSLITYFGSAKVKKYIQSYIQSGRKEFIYIDKLGIYSKDLIINEAGTYILDIGANSYYVSIDDETSKLREEVFTFDRGSELKDVVKQIKNIQTIYKPSIVSTLFTHFGLSMCLKGVADLGDIEMPYGVLVGLTQSGKTYTRKLLMKMFGLKKQLEIQASTTQFVVLRKMRHYIPMNVGEYNTEEIRFDWDHFMKSLYDGTNEARGTSGQTLNKYEANGTLFIDGENKSNNMAVYTRGIVYFMNPRYRMDVDDINQITRSFKNILGYFIENFDKIKSIPAVIQEERRTVNKALEGVDVQDKVRIASNYSLLLAFAKVFGFYEHVLEDILEQMHEQIKMMGDNNVDKIIKNVMTLAVSNEMVCDINAKGVLTIDFIVDILRYSSKKIDAIISDINTVNHQFGTKGDNAQTLGIPLEYIFKTKAIHIISNSIFNMVYERSNDFNMGIARRVHKYAQENGYTKSRFVGLIETHPEFNPNILY